MPPPKNKGRIGARTKVHQPCGLWGDYEIGDDCTIGRFAEIGDGVRIGNRCKVEAFAFIPPGVAIEDDVLVGPHAYQTNDTRARAVGESMRRMALAIGRTGGRRHIPDGGTRSLEGALTCTDRPTG